MRSAESSAGGTGAARPRILVVDDEEPIRRILQIMLARLGYEADCVGTAEQATATYQAARQAGRPYAAAIVDLSLAEGVTGLDVLENLRRLDPAVRAVLVSGYVRDPSEGAALPDGFRSTLPKPFRTEDLTRALRQALESA